MVEAPATRWFALTHRPCDNLGVTARKKLFVALATVAVLLLSLGAATYVYFSPHLALREIEAAAERHDTSALSERVDFPAVRASLKQQIKARIDQGAEQSQSPFAALGSALAGALADPAVDALVTPDNVAAMLRGEAFGPAQAPRVELDARGVEMGYIDAHTFEVTTAGDAAFRLLLERDGLLGWKLTDVKLPQAWSWQAPGSVPTR